MSEWNSLLERRSPLGGKAVRATHQNEVAYDAAYFLEASTGQWQQLPQTQGPVHVVLNSSNNYVINVATAGYHHGGGRDVKPQVSFGFGAHTPLSALPEWSLKSLKLYATGEDSQALIFVRMALSRGGGKGSDAALIHRIIRSNPRGWHPPHAAIGAARRQHPACWPTAQSAGGCWLCCAAASSNGTGSG